MASHTELVAVRVTEIGRVVVLVTLRHQARRTLRRTTVGKSHRDGFIDSGPTLREECNHLPVARLVTLPIERPSDQEKRPRPRLGLPARPGSTGIAEAGLDAKRGSVVISAL